MAIILRIEGILLAAGESRRMGFPKPLLKLDGDTFIARAAAAMLEVVARLVVVIGAHAERVRAAVPADPRIVVVENPRWQRGQLSSLKVGLGAISPDCAAAIVHLIDHPTVLGASFRALAEEYRRIGKPILIARYRGRRGHPAIFGRALFPELAAAPQEQGARSVVNADPSRVAYLDLDDPGIVLDLDTPGDLERAGLSRPPSQT